MFVIPTGFEPVTYRLEICCSIQLSYRTILHLNQKIRPPLADGFSLSGWQDLNLRPSAPKADAIPGYATPRGVF